MQSTDQTILKTLLQVRAEVRELKLASKEVLTFKEAVAYTGYTKSYIYRLVSNKIIPHSKPNGKTLFFERKELERWLMSKRYSSINENQEKARKFLNR